MHENFPSGRVWSQKEEGEGGGKQEDVAGHDEKHKSTVATALK